MSAFMSGCRAIISHDFQRDNCIKATWTAALMSVSKSRRSASFKPPATTLPQTGSPNTSRQSSGSRISLARPCGSSASTFPCRFQIFQPPARQSLPKGKDGVREPERLRRSGPPDENGGKDHDTHHAQTGGLVHRQRTALTAEKAVQRTGQRAAQLHRSRDSPVFYQNDQV